MIFDRPMWPPGAEIAAQAFAAFGAWETKYSADLAEVEDIVERTAIYSIMHDGIDIDLAKAMAALDKRYAKATHDV